MKQVKRIIGTLLSAAVIFPFAPKAEADRRSDRNGHCRKKRKTKTSHGKHHEDNVCAAFA